MTTKKSATAPINAAYTPLTKNLTTLDASVFLNVSVAWLERQRWLGTGPQYIKIGRSVRYPDAELANYIAANLVNTLSKV